MPMSLARASSYANLASRMRAQCRARGTNWSGHPLWTEAEDETCRKLHPDYQALETALPRRTRCAIRFRCQFLGLTSPAKFWTGDEQSRLRKLYRTSTSEELKAAFPDRSRISLEHRAKKIGIVRARQPYRPTREQLLDELRAECFRQNITMPDLDVIANGKGYFKRKAWAGPHGCIDMNRIVKAIRELGGKISVRWEDDL